MLFFFSHLILNLQVEVFVLSLDNLLARGRTQVRHVRLGVAHVVSTLRMWEKGGRGSMRGIEDVCV